MALNQASSGFRLECASPVNAVDIRYPASIPGTTGNITSVAIELSATFQ
tara:strand:+ start:306547 stop:306693 length:147 start_codon:yes stop_codon:yes gene_type:complete